MDSPDKARCYCSLARRQRSEVPWYAKILAGAVGTYALSPIDLIPDFIPVLGYLDDLLIVSAGIWMAVKLIPPDVMEHLRAEAHSREKPSSMVGAAVMIALWIIVATIAFQRLGPANLS